MLGTDTDVSSAVKSAPTCLYSAPNWYCSHIIDCNEQYIAYGARVHVQVSVIVINK